MAKLDGYSAKLKQCPGCEKEYAPIRSNQKYCSKTCRNKVWFATRPIEYRRARMRGSFRQRWVKKKREERESQKQKGDV